MLTKKDNKMLAKDELDNEEALFLQRIALFAIDNDTGIEYTIQEMLSILSTCIVVLDRMRSVNSATNIDAFKTSLDCIDLFIKNIAAKRLGELLFTTKKTYLN